MAQRITMKVSVQEDLDPWMDPLNQNRRVRPLEIGHRVTVHETLEPRNAPIFEEAIRIMTERVNAIMEEGIRDHLRRIQERPVPPAPATEGWMEDALRAHPPAMARMQQEAIFQATRDILRTKPIDGALFRAQWFDEPKPAAKDLSTLW